MGFESFIWMLYLKKNNVSYRENNLNCGPYLKFDELISEEREREQYEK